MDTDLNNIAIEQQIISSLQRYEPRIEIDTVLVSVDGENNSMSAQVTYDIVGIPAPTQIVDVLLHPARV